jgi:FtsP/CotA-like multicopper oxidase with cupredoxin domain/peroxiredoxin
MAPTEVPLTAAQSRSLALASTNSFRDPVHFHSVNRTLEIALDVTKARNRIGEDPVLLRSYNGQLVGPTLRMKPGDKVKISLYNKLPSDMDLDGDHNTLQGFNITNLHYHGLHVSPAGSGDNVLLIVRPLKSQVYDFKIPENHPAGTFWYHPHRHGSTAAQVGSGMAGAFIVEGGLDEVPEIAAARDRVWVLQQIPYVYTDSRSMDGPGKKIRVTKVTDDRTGKVTYYSTVGDKKVDVPPEFVVGVVEQDFAEIMFNPGDVGNLRRFTTVNGVVLPVVRMRPGEVERWRMIDTGNVERIDLKLEKASGDGPQTLPFHEIALDGLPLGKVIRRDSVELWPAYRSDLLVQAPDQPGQYLLRDSEVKEGEGNYGLGKSRSYIARLVIEGEPHPMKLPRDEQLARYRLPSIPPDKVTGKQVAWYGLNLPKPGDTIFQVDGKSYDEANPRKLFLNGVDEWTIYADNKLPGAEEVRHPFHIHVNPFEVFWISEKGKPNVNTLTEPVWRDTLILEPGRTVKFRTRYDDFTGDFVQHCHILDHEDQGMMELIQIINPREVAAAPAPGRARGAHSRAVGAVPAAGAAAGRAAALESLRGRPAVVLLTEGLGCSACTRQLTDFTAAFRGQDVQVVGVTPDPVIDGAVAAELKLPILADPGLEIYKRFGCTADGAPQHGTIVLDRAGRVAWSITGPVPLTDTEAVRRQLARLAAAPRSGDPTQVAPGGQ